VSELFLLQFKLYVSFRSTLPKFALMIMNRLNRENLNETISKEMEIKVQKPFLLYKNSSSMEFIVLGVDLQTSKLK
jgi:hypothetical protein